MWFLTNLNGLLVIHVMSLCSFEDTAFQLVGHLWKNHSLVTGAWYHIDMVHVYLCSNFPLIIFHTISCPLYNLKTVREISVKLGTLIKHDETMCHAEEF